MNVNCATLVPAMYACYCNSFEHMTKYQKENKFIIIWLKTNPKYPAGTTLIKIMSSAYERIGELILPRNENRSDDFRFLRAQMVFHDHAPHDIEIYFQDSFVARYGLHDEREIIERSVPRYDNVPFYITRKDYSYVIGIATNYAEMCKINEMQPYIVKIEIMIAIFCQSSLPKDIWQNITMFLAELIRLDASIYIGS